MDISHTWMACSELKIDFYDAIELVSPYCNYYHVADASYPAAEGVQIGDGDINFKKIDQYFKQNMYIPEVWNGHLDNFNGFKKALNKL